MATNDKNKTGGNLGSQLGFEAEMFKAADKLRGNMEPSDYKHVALGLIFLKYISDAFEARHKALLAEDPQAAEDKDEYLADNVSWVPKDARWSHLQANAKLPHLYDLFPDRLVESELGERPEGWEVTSLSEFSSLNPETWTKRTRPRAISYVDLSNTKWGRVESVTNYEAADASSRAQRVLRPLDTIVGTVRPGNGSYALISDEGLTGSTGFAVLRPIRRECSEFVYLAATARENIERLSNLADGGA